MIGHAFRVFIASRSITGLFHDAVEDGWLPRWIMWRSLDAITRRDGEVYADYIERVALDPVARRVKICDLNDNLTRGGGPHASLRQRYRRALLRLTQEVAR